MDTHFEQVPIDVVEAALQQASEAPAKTPQTPPEPSPAPAHKAVAEFPTKAKSISRKGQQ